MLNARGIGISSAGIIYMLSSEKRINYLELKQGKQNLAPQLHLTLTIEIIKEIFYMCFNQLIMFVSLLLHISTI